MIGQSPQSVVDCGLMAQPPAKRPLLVLDPEKLTPAERLNLDADGFDAYADVAERAKREAAARWDARVAELESQRINPATPMGHALLNACLSYPFPQSH